MLSELFQNLKLPIYHYMLFEAADFLYMLFLCLFISGFLITGNLYLPTNNIKILFYLHNKP